MSEVETKVPGKLVSAGQPVPFNVNIPLASAAPEGSGAAETPEQIAAKAKLAEETANNNSGAATQKTQAEIDAEKIAEDEKVPRGTKPLTDDEIKAEYEKRFPTKLAPTTEELKAQETALEKRMLDFYLEKGGTVEQFAGMKQIASADLTELSKSQLTKELKEAGFNEDQIKAIQKERYYQLEQAEIDEITDPVEKELAQKKLDWGKKKLEGKATHIKKQAEESLNTLKQVIAEQDKQTATSAEAKKLQATKETELTSNVEAHFKTVERKLTLQLGKVDDIEISPVEYEVPETAIAEAESILKDPAKRKQLLYNDDGGLNIKSLSEILLKAKMFESAAKTSYLEGGNRQVEIFKKVFPIGDARAIGVGGGGKPKTGQPGKIVSAGKPQRFNPAVNQ